MSIFIVAIFELMNLILKFSKKIENSMQGILKQKVYDKDGKKEMMVEKVLFTNLKTKKFLLNCFRN